VPNRIADSVWWQWARQHWQLLLGVTLAVLLLLQIRQYGELADWWQQVGAAVDGATWGYLALTILLIPVNWGLESGKWLLLLRAQWPDVSFGRVVRAVLAGIAVSLATPNRVGEYGGRALLFPWQRLSEVVLSSLVGSWCQWLVFLLLGWPALIYQLGPTFGWPPLWRVVLAAVVPLSLAVLVLLGPTWWKLLGHWIQTSRLGQTARWRWLRRKLLPLSTMERYRFGQALGLALLRFLTYSTQYLLLLWFFGVPLSLLEGLAGIFSIYLIQAGIPLPPGLGVMTRSEIAILIWRSVQVHPLSLISATFTLYVLNLVLPALPGIWFIVKKKKTQPYNDVYTKQ
jgi:uncharacterized membrane protein YbhN (UPF0104 family)